MVEANKADFEDRIKDGLVLVDFYTPMCGPCRMMAPILGELQNIKILKVDVSGDNKELAMKYGFSAVPTLIFFKGGTEVYRTTGFVKKVDLQNKIDELNVTEIS